MNYDDIVENLIVSRVDVGGHKEDLRKLEALKAVLKNIPTEKGKKYALSKFLNETPGYEFNELKASNPNLDEDYWSLKHQDDYTPPDVEKTLEKANKENAKNFWNWDSDEHWSKRSTEELKRQADRAGYGDNLPGYLDKVREIQTDKDREKVYDENAMPGTKFLYPRATEALLRGEDIEPSDVLMDVVEQGLYTFNPGGRAAALLAGGAKAGKAAKAGAYLADIATNPLVMETLDAAKYDDPNNARSKFNVADAAMGAGINAGIGRIMNRLNLKRGNRDYINSEEYNTDRKIVEDLKNELKLSQNEGNIKAVDILNRQILDKLGGVVNKMKKPSFKSNLTDKYLRNLLLKDAANDAASLISNKSGDVVLEDPKLSRRLISGAARGIYGLPQIVGDLVDDYYKLKDKNVEQDKINQAIRLLGK